jgi:hypothetical protein
MMAVKSTKAAALRLGVMKSGRMQNTSTPAIENFYRYL